MFVIHVYANDEKTDIFVCLFDFILYIPVHNFSDISVQVFLAKQGLMCLAQGNNAVTPVRLEPATPQSQVKHSTTEPLRSLLHLS